MSDPIREIFNQAQGLQKCGQYDRAEKLYLEVLAQRPGYVDAIAFLGVIAMQK